MREQYRRKKMVREKERGGEMNSVREKERGNGRERERERKMRLTHFYEE